jgi:hypothetical protein
MSRDEDWPGALLAEFTEAGSLVDALRRVRDAGYRQVDAFTPFPVKNVAEVLDLDGWPGWRRQPSSSVARSAICCNGI